MPIVSGRQLLHLTFNRSSVYLYSSRQWRWGGFLYSISCFYVHTFSDLFWPFAQFSCLSCWRPRHYNCQLTEEKTLLGSKGWKKSLKRKVIKEIGKVAKINIFVPRRLGEKKNWSTGLPHIVLEMSNYCSFTNSKELFCQQKDFGRRMDVQYLSFMDWMGPGFDWESKCQVSLYKKINKEQQTAGNCTRHKQELKNIKQHEIKIICWLHAKVLKKILLFSINAWHMWWGLLSTATTPYLNLIFVKLIELLLF